MTGNSELVDFTHSQLRRLCAATKHTGSVVESEVTPLPIETLQMPPRFSQYMGEPTHLGFGP